MAKKRFGLLATIKAEDEKDLTLKEYHQYWRKTNSISNASFTPLYSAFKDKHLKTLDGGPLRLYLFFAFAANNQYGHSWHSIERIADYFGTQTRTIDNWIRVLVDENLIYREKKGKKSHTTYLIPYSNTILRHSLTKKITVDDQDVLNSFVKKIKEREFLYGQIVDVFHFFQWKSNKNNKPVTTGNIQWLFVITKRVDEVLIGHFYTLKNSTNMGVSELDVEDLAIFESPYKYEGSNIQGVALTHSIKLVNSNSDAVLTLMNSIVTDESWEWQEYPSVYYGKVAEFFEQVEEEEV